MAATRARDAGLPCPGVHFQPEFVRRLERMVTRLAAARERREGAGGAALAGGGEEFVGHRPYRYGEDLRHLDWALFARLGRPYVRVTRREASEHWCVFVDTSASMGVGPPGKLQAAAEVACGVACVGIRMGATVEVVVSAPNGPGAAEGVVRRTADLPALFAFFEGQRAAGSRGLGDLLAGRRPPAGAGRVFLIGDLCDLEPRAALSALARGRELFCVQLLAPVELAPPPSVAVEWLDPEGSGRLSLDVDAAALAAYERGLEERLEAWGTLATRHGFRYGCWRSDRPFEDVVRGTLDPS